MINQTKFTAKKHSNQVHSKKNTEPKKPFNSHKSQVNKTLLTPTRTEKTRKKTQQAASSQAHKFSDSQIFF